MDDTFQTADAAGACKHVNQTSRRQQRAPTRSTHWLLPLSLQNTHTVPHCPITQALRLTLSSLSWVLKVGHGDDIVAIPGACDCLVVWDSIHNSHLLSLVF